MLVLGAIIVLCSVVAHMLQRRFWFAVAMAACSSALLFQIAAFVHLGHLDPFFMIALAVSLPIGAFGAILIGGLFRLGRK